MRNICKVVFETQRNPNPGTKFTAVQSPHYSIFAWLLLAAALTGASCGKKSIALEQKPRHSVTVTWKASSSPVVGYAIYRAPVPGGQYTRLVSKPVSGTQYQDTSVEAGHTYSYYVTAVNAINVESRASEVVTATVPSP